MASTNRVVPMLVAGAAGVAGAFYIFSPKTELSGKPSAAGAPKDGRSQSAKDGGMADGPSSSTPHPALRYGGAAPQSGSGTVAGTTQEGRQGYSADHNPSLHTGDKGGVGVKEMKERKEGGQTQGLAGQLNNKSNAVGGEKKGRWWLFGY